MNEIRVYQTSSQQSSEQDGGTQYFSSCLSSRESPERRIKKITPKILLDNRTTMEESPVALKDGLFSSCAFSRESHFRECIAHTYVRDLETSKSITE